MCVHASGSVWVWNHDGWAAEEQRAGDCVRRRAVRLHPSPLNAAAAAAPRLRDTMLTSQWILGDLSCQVAGFKPREDAVHNSILILYLSSFYLALHLLLFSFTLLLFPFCSPISLFSPSCFSTCLYLRSAKTFLHLPVGSLDAITHFHVFFHFQRTVQTRQHAFSLQPQRKTVLEVGMFWCDSPTTTLYRSVRFISHVHLGTSS